MPTLMKNTFKAWIDRMRGGGPKLIVMGDVQVRTTGWHVVLTRRSPQGFNPDILLLDVSAQPPEGRAADKVTTIPLRYEELPPHHEYSEVTVVDGKDDVTIGVGSTQ